MLIKSDADMVVRNLRGLASAGFHIELDDFGTGHASIANLRRFMVNRIKIDRGFIDGIETSEEQQTLTASMIAMAHALGIGTLAEGVETEDARGRCCAGSAATSSRDSWSRGRCRWPIPSVWLAGFRGHPPRHRRPRPPRAGARPEYALTFRHRRLLNPRQLLPEV